MTLIKFFVSILAVRTMALTVLLAGAAAAGDDERRITVIGTGQIAVIPDMATITIGVTHEAKEAVAAMDATSEATARVLDRLADLGIAARDMQTGTLSLNPLWSDTSSSVSGPSKISGFVASNALLVRVRDLDALGAVVQAVVADGANDFNGLRFSLQDPDPATDEARKQAVVNGISRARLFADAAGVTLGPVLTITEQGGGRPVQMEMAAAARSGGVPVAAGEVTVQAGVTMVFAIVD